MKGGGSRQDPPPQAPASKPATTYRPMPPREFALGSEMQRSANQTSPAFTLMPSSSLRRSATGSQYSWSSRGSGSHSRGGSWRGPQTQPESTSDDRGGGLSCTSITMTEKDAASSVDNVDGQHKQRDIDVAEQQQQKTDASAMGRISEEDGASTSGISSLKQYNPRESEERVEIFERSDVFDRSSGSDSIGYNPIKSNSPNESLLHDGDEEHGEDNNERKQQINIHLPSSELKSTNAAPLAMTNIKSPESISTMGSEPPQNDLAITARFGKLLQQCRELTETCDNSTLNESDRFDSPNRSVTNNTRPIPPAQSSSFQPAAINPNSEIQTSTRLYNASEITMDTLIKTDDGITSRRNDKSVVSELSLGVDRMYNDSSTGQDYLERSGTGTKSPYPPGSPVSELSVSDSDALANLVHKSNGQTKQSKGKDRPDFMRYLSNVTEKDDDDKRSWLSYTDDERTPRNSTQQIVATFQVPIATEQSGSQLKKRMASVSAPHQSPQSSFYSTDFSDEGTGGLLVGFGKRRKGNSDSDSSSSSSGFSDSSETSDYSGTSSSSSESESEEETEESDPSMPTIARRGLSLTHQQDDEVSALSFGGASALVASAPPRVQLATPKLLPQETSRISESTSTPTKSLERECEEKKESSPESEASKQSSKSSGSGFLSAGGRPRRRSSLSGTENLSREGNDNSIVSKRRATIGDLPQLEEESSQASSGSPLPRKSITSREEPSGDDGDVVLGAEEAKGADTKDNDALTSIAGSAHFQQTGSVTVASGERNLNKTDSVNIKSGDGVTGSGNGESISLQTGYSERQSVTNVGESTMTTDFSRKDDSGPINTQTGDAFETTMSIENTEIENMGSVIESNFEYGTSGDIQTHTGDIKLKQSIEEMPAASSPEIGHLTRVSEDKSHVESSSDHVIPSSNIGSLPIENRHPNEYPIGNAMLDDDISATSSLSSVVSKARVSFLNICSTSVASVISDRTHEETRSKGSFRKSASDMIAERQSSKSSIESKSQDSIHMKANTDSTKASDMIAESQSSKSSIESKSKDIMHMEANMDSAKASDTINERQSSKSSTESKSQDSMHMNAIMDLAKTIDMIAERQSSKSSTESKSQDSIQMEDNMNSAMNEKQQLDLGANNGTAEHSNELDQNKVDKREQYRQSMLDVAKDMSSRLEKSFMARSQLHVQANDFESRSYEDLSSASEEDAVLAYLKGETFTEEKSILDSSDDILEDDTKAPSAKSEAGSFWTRLRNSVLKSVLEEDTKGKTETKDKTGEGSNAPSASGSEYVMAEMRPMFSGSDESSGVVLELVDDSDVDVEFVAPIKFNDGSEHSNSSGRKRADEISISWYFDKEFYRSSYFIVPLCFFLFVIFILSMIAGISGSKNNKAILSAAPTISEVIPSTTPTSRAPPSVWVQGKLMAVGEDIKGDIGDELGFSVSASKLGSRFIVGSRRSDKDNMKNRGAASIYEFDAFTSTYVLVSEIHGEQAGDQCGYSVSISEDGKRVAIGSLGSDKNGNNSGQVRIFDESSSKEWILITEFHGEAVGSLFGTSISLSHDGTKVAIGAPYYGNTESSRFGKTYVYQELDDKLWNPVGEPIAGLVSNGLLGWSVSWSPDATLLAIGAPGEDSISSSGYAKVYKFDANEWHDFGDTISNDIAGDRFGFSVHLGGNDNTYSLAIGAPGMGEGSGYAGVYKFENSQWLRVGNGILGGWGENLGYAVSLTPDASRMVVGVPNKFCNGLPCGQIQIIYIQNESPVFAADFNGDEGGDLGVSVSVSYDGRMVYGGMPGRNLIRVFGEL